MLTKVTPEHLREDGEHQAQRRGTLVIAVHPDRFSRCIKQAQAASHGFNIAAAWSVLARVEPLPKLIGIELIDKCVGSRIWVVMKGDKGTI